MSLETVTQRLKERVGTSAGLDKIVKFDFGEDGVLRIDDTAHPAVVSNDDGPADLTIKVALDDFEAIANGEQNPQMAFMMGKLQVEGDMGLAMRLGQILG
ncbi:MAG: sterol-binding protein [Alphaproteobacteria bacterium]|nr:MAG: sterol-binding protein [Alphaproteobacteria bacterium]